MTHDEALHISINFLKKVHVGKPQRLDYLRAAEEDKDCKGIYFELEDVKNFLERIKTALKQEND